MSSTPPDSRRIMAVVGVLSLAVFMSSLDLFIVNLAFPYISRQYPGTTLSSLSWVLPADVGERQVDDEQVQAGHEDRQGQHAHDRGHLAGTRYGGRLCGRGRRGSGHGALQ